MTLFEAYRDDMHELLDALDAAEVFAPGEIEAWREGIDEADHVSDLMRTNDAMAEVLGDRERFESVLNEQGINSESSTLSPHITHG